MSKGTNIIGVLTMVTDHEGNQSFGLINPERMYVYIQPGQIPEEWMRVCAAMAGDPTITVLGLLADGGKL